MFWQLLFFQFLWLVKLKDLFEDECFPYESFASMCHQTRFFVWRSLLSL